MIEAHEFVEASRKKGFGWYAGVPCSFLTPIINYVVNDEQLTYISSANEGDAVAAAAGAAIGGQGAVVMIQNSGLGNAVNPLTSLTHTFRIPLLLICTLRGDPNLQDEPQHELMGQITGEMLQMMGIPWEFFPTEVSEIEPLLQRIMEYLNRESRPYALIMRKATLAPHALKFPKINNLKSSTQAEKKSLYQSFFPSGVREPISRNQVVRRIVELTSPNETVVIGTTGYTGRELFSVEDRSNQLYMVGSMGCVSSLGLGLSLVRPDLQVVIIDGDGAALMRMGNFATVGAYGGRNLIHILLDNEVHDSTGGQATVSPAISFAQIAQACGYGITFEGDDLALVDALFATVDHHKPRFGHLKIRPGTIKDLPRPSLHPEAVRQRLMNHLTGN